MEICPECTADASVKKVGEKISVNCGYCGIFVVDQDYWEYQKDTVKNLTGVTLREPTTPEETNHAQS